MWHRWRLCGVQIRFVPDPISGSNTTFAVIDDMMRPIHSTEKGDITRKSMLLSGRFFRTSIQSALMILFKYSPNILVSLVFPLPLTLEMVEHNLAHAHALGGNFHQFVGLDIL